MTLRNYIALIGMLAKRQKKRYLHFIFLCLILVASCLVILNYANKAGSAEAFLNQSKEGQAYRQLLLIPKENHSAELEKALDIEAVKSIKWTSKNQADIELYNYEDRQKVVERIQEQGLAEVSLDANIEDTLVLFKGASYILRVLSAVMLIVTILAVGIFNLQFIEEKEGEVAIYTAVGYPGSLIVAILWAEFQVIFSASLIAGVVLLELLEITVFKFVLQKTSIGWLFLLSNEYGSSRFLLVIGFYILLSLLLLLNIKIRSRRFQRSHILAIA